jgi:hypothetical protein
MIECLVNCNKTSLNLNGPPIHIINRINIALKILILYPIDLFSMLNFNLILTIFHKKSPKPQCEFSILVTNHYDLWHAIVFYPHIRKKNFIVSIVVVVILTALNFANLGNLSTTIKMASFPCHSEKHIIKFIHTFSYTDLTKLVKVYTT